MNGADLERADSWLGRLGGAVTIAELLLAAAILLLAFLAPGAGRGWFERIERGAATLARSRWGAILAVGALVLLARAAFLPWFGPPVPISYDENSLVLQAQTFAAGRWANPTPPFWEHFEAVYVNLVPAYASMYFPGRGLPLAAGLAVAGHPWIGAWLSFVLMAMAAVWMLQGWVSRPLALLGGVLVVLRLGVFSYWVNSYQGGAFAALGGMLVVGAVPRVLRSPGWSNGLALAVGAVILLITRPVEGALLCVPIGIFMLAAMLRKKAYPWARLAVRVALPVAALCALGGAALLAHNRATTGDALTAPYDLNRQAYAITPAFLTQPRIEGEQRGPAYFRKVFEAEDASYARRSSAGQLAIGVAAKLFYNWNFYLGLLLTAPFIAGLWAARTDYMLTGTAALFFAGYAFQTWNFPHYTAPIYPVILVILMKGFGWLRAWRPRGRDAGLFLARALPAATLLVLAVPASSVVTGWPALESNARSQACCALQQSTLRAQLSARLNAVPGRDLVMVNSDMLHPTFEPTVYNDPDIAGADVIWAHKLDPRKDAALQRFHAGRTVWELDWADDGTPRLGRVSPIAQIGEAEAGGRTRP